MTWLVVQGRPGVGEQIFATPSYFQSLGYAVMQAIIMNLFGTLWPPKQLRELMIDDVTNLVGSISETESLARVSMTSASPILISFSKPKACACITDLVVLQFDEDNFGFFLHHRITSEPRGGT